MPLNLKQTWPCRLSNLILRIRFQTTPRQLQRRGERGLGSVSLPDSWSQNGTKYLKWSHCNFRWLPASQFLEPFLGSKISWFSLYRPLRVRHSLLYVRRASSYTPPPPVSWLTVSLVDSRMATRSPSNFQAGLWLFFGVDTVLRSCREQEGQPFIPSLPFMCPLSSSSFHFLNFRVVTYKLCGPWEITWPLCTSVSSSRKMRLITASTSGSLWGWNEYTHSFTYTYI